MSSTPKLHVALVEDDDLLAELLMKSLDANDIDCARYANGLDAVSGISAGPDVSLLLLDISLPDIDGFEVLKRLRADVRFATMPVVVVSNFSQVQDEEWGKKLGVERFLNKVSLTPADIIDVVMEVAARKNE